MTRITGPLHSPPRRFCLSDDARRLLVATGAALVLHGVVFAGIAFVPVTEHTSRAAERIAVVVTPAVPSSHQQDAAEAVPEVSPDATPDAPAAAIPHGESRVTPEAVDTAGVPELTDVPAPEHRRADPQASEPQETEPRDAAEESDGVTPVRLSDGTVERVFGEETSQPEPETSEGKSARPTIHPDRRYVKPEYPERARRAGVEGTTVVTFEIDRRGRPDRISLEKSSGSTLLDREAIRAVQLWRFSRGSAGRVSVHRIEFRLEGGS